MSQKKTTYFFSCPKYFGNVRSETKEKAKEKVRKDCGCKKKCKIILK